MTTGIARHPLRSARIACAAALLLAATAARAGAYVDRSLGMDHLLGKPALPQLSTVPANAIRTNAIQNDPDQPPPSSQADAYSVDAVSPTIYSKNVVYSTLFQLPLHLKARATVTGVIWKYGTKSRPAGFDAAICWNGGKLCRNITNLGTGHTDAFNGRDATQPFTLMYQVIGTGTLAPPVYGDSAQIIVNYRLWN